MLKKSSLYVGIAPITKEHTQRVAEKLVKRGVISKNATYQEKIQITTKSLVKSWTNRYLEVTEDDWKEMEIEQIQSTENSDIVFMKFKNQNGATMLTSRAQNLPNDTGPNTPRLVMHIDIRAKKRHQAILQVAKAMREHAGNTIQTSVRAEKRDYLLRSRPKGSKTPWQEIPPVILTQDLPQFEIGKYRDIFNPENNPEEEEDEEQGNDEEGEEEDEEIERIARDIKNEKIENEKRERSEEESLENLSNITNQRKQIRIDNDISEEEKNKEIMNSTPIPINILETPAQKPAQIL